MTPRADDSISRIATGDVSIRQNNDDDDEEKNK